MRLAVSKRSLWPFSIPFHADLSYQAEKNRKPHFSVYPKAHRQACLHKPGCIQNQECISFPDHPVSGNSLSNPIIIYLHAVF